jgi:plasmid stability protein
MAHLVLQDVDPRVVEALGVGAERHGRTIEEEARTVLEGALGLSRAGALESARRLRQQWEERPLAPSRGLLRADGDRVGEAERRPGGGIGGAGGAGAAGAVGASGASGGEGG